MPLRAAGWGNAPPYLGYKAYIHNPVEAEYAVNGGYTILLR